MQGGDCGDSVVAVFTLVLPMVTPGVPAFLAPGPPALATVMG